MILVFKNGPIPASFSVYFRLFNMLQLKFKFKLIKVYMVCLGFEPGVAGWKARTNPLSYGCTSYNDISYNDTRYNDASYNYATYNDTTYKDTSYDNTSYDDSTCDNSIYDGTC